MTIVSKEWGSEGRKRAEMQKLEEIRVTRAKNKVKKDRQREELERRRLHLEMEPAGMRVECSGCGYEQLDVVVFEDKNNKTRFGAVRYNLCPRCQTVWMDRGMELRFVGPVRE